MWSRKEIKARGKECFKRNYWKSVLVGIVYSLFFASSSGVAWKQNGEQIEQAMAEGTIDEQTLIIIAVAILAVLAFVAIIVALFDTFLFNPLEVGCNRFFIQNLDANADLGEMGYAFKHGYLSTVGGIFLRNFLIALCCVLFIIPGIILSYSYRLVPYLLADEPGIKAVEALKKSRAMMKGHKFNAFVYDLSFILWDILVVLTLGLAGIFYVNPYKLSSDAALYKAIKG